MKIKKISQSIGVLGKILNTKSTSTENTYSCDYINKLNDYSTEEQVIGTWIDGRPLYRRVIETTTPSSTDITYAIATLSSECRIRLYNGYVYDGGQVFPLNLYLGSENFYYSYGYMNEYRMKLANTNRVDKTCVLILDYIKTTDSVTTTSLETD